MDKLNSVLLFNLLSGLVIGFLIIPFTQFSEAVLAFVPSLRF